MTDPTGATPPSAAKPDAGSGKASKDTSAPSAAAPASAVPAQVKIRPERYMIASQPAPGQLQTLAVDEISDALNAMPGVDIVGRIKPRGLSVLSAGPGGGVGDILLAEMSAERGESLKLNAPAGVIVERDELLQHAGPARDSFALLDAQFPVVGQPQRISVDVAVKVVGTDGRPVPKATVMIYGQAFPAQGVTDANGEVVVTVSGGDIGSLRALYVKPSADYWDRVIMQPHLTASQSNVVTLHSLTETFPGFPVQGLLGWGQRLMGLDRINPRFRGGSVKVGIIDSGCDNTHPQLTHVTNGFNFVPNEASSDWTDDELSHGTHCAGIIGARRDTVAGIAGFAPDAEIHALKVFPGGRFSDLIDALDMAMSLELDVVNMSLGSPQSSDLVQQKLTAGVAAGTACIVAAGNSAGAVEFPGAAPGAITISAIGDVGQYPPDSDHAYTLLADGAGSNGLFSAKFSCFGPEVALCAPGVAIVSTVPGGYAAWDGTSMATPHVTGLAALLLAHHPALQGVPRAGRVGALWQVMRSCATPVLADPARGGAGLPALPPQLLAVGASADASPAAANPSFVIGLGSGGSHATAATPEGLVLADLCSNPEIRPLVMQRIQQLRTMGAI